MSNLLEEILKNEMFCQSLNKVFTMMRGYLDEKEDAKVTAGATTCSLNTGRKMKPALNLRLTCLIDFQIIRVASPVCNLAHCLYSGVSKTELNRLDEYLTVYTRVFHHFKAAGQQSGQAIFV